MRIKLRWDAIQEANDEKMEEAEQQRGIDVPMRQENRRFKERNCWQEAAISLFKSSEKWSPSTKRKSQPKFFLREYPELGQAYRIMSFTQNESSRKIQSKMRQVSAYG